MAESSLHWIERAIRETRVKDSPALVARAIAHSDELMAAIQAGLHRWRAIGGADEAERERLIREEVVRIFVTK